jgi:hypothetical protein
MIRRRLRHGAPELRVVTEVDAGAGFSSVLRTSHETLGLFHGTSYAARAGWEGSGLDHVCGLFGNRDPTGALVLPEVFVGIIDASITRKPAGPCTRNSSFTTALGSWPILHVPTT